MTLLASTRLSQALRRGAQSRRRRSLRAVLRHVSSSRLALILICLVGLSLVLATFLGLAFAETPTVMHGY